jgi:hypothetical protein
VLGEVVELAGTHRRRLVRFGVIVTEHVENPVHHQQGQFVVEAAGVRGCVLGGDSRAHDHVAEQHRPGYVAGVVGGVERNDNTSVAPS